METHLPPHSQSSPHPSLGIVSMKNFIMQPLEKILIEGYKMMPVAEYT